MIGSFAKRRLFSQVRILSTFKSSHLLYEWIICLEMHLINIEQKQAMLKRQLFLKKKVIMHNIVINSLRIHVNHLAKM